MKTLYLAYGGAEVTVFDSQVLELLKLLGGEGVKTTLVAFQNWKEYFFKRSYVQEKFELTKKMLGYPPIFIPRAPRNLAWLNTWRLERVLKNLPDVGLIHARGLGGAALACQLKASNKNLRVLFDCRGLEAEEYALIVEGEKKRNFNWADRFWFKHLKTLEKETALHADRIFCVSQALKDFLMGEYRVPDEKIDVTPCCVNLERFRGAARYREAIRSEIGANSRLVFVYAGSIRAWQKASWLADFLAAAKQANPKSFLLALTPQRSHVMRVLTAGGCQREDFYVTTTSHDLTPRYLAAGDVGILLRETHPVNRVACPTKTGEYLASGNLILTTSHPQDLALMVKKEGIGEVVESPGDLKGLGLAVERLSQKIESLGGQVREKTHKAAEKYFSWDKYLPLILKRYGSLV